MGTVPVYLDAGSPWDVTGAVRTPVVEILGLAPSEAGRPPQDLDHRSPPVRDRGGEPSMNGDSPHSSQVTVPRRASTAVDGDRAPSTAEREEGLSGTPERRGAHEPDREKEAVSKASPHASPPRRVLSWGDQSGRRIRRAPLVPPKPNEFVKPTSSFAGRATCGTKSRSQPSPGASRLSVAGRI